MTEGRREPLYRTFDPAPLAALSADYARIRDRRPGDLAAQQKMLAALLGIGRALYAWLDGDDGWFGRFRTGRAGALELEIQAVELDAEGRTLLYAPWEILADDRSFLALDGERLYAPIRRLGLAETPLRPTSYRLGLGFMAAAPRGLDELDFEAEEATILDATRSRLEVFVDETGELQSFADRLGEFNPALQICHLSCHGGLGPADPLNDQEIAPVLFLEHADGTSASTPVEALIAALAPNRPRLAFLSACLTATGRFTATAGVEALADALAARLVRGGMPAVIGWDGRVSDAAATAFARGLYEQLALGALPAVAAARARRNLLSGALSGMGSTGRHKGGGPAPSNQLAEEIAAAQIAIKRDWHLARLWVGPQGGGALVGRGMLAERRLRGAGASHRVVSNAKGAELKVASPGTFVGRRRQLQNVLRALSGGGHGGALLRGLGCLGKTSMAARLADRMPHHKLAVVHGKYDGIAIIEALTAALKTYKPARALLQARKAEVVRAPALLGNLLVDLLTGPCASAGHGQPVLLLIDDLEQVLQVTPGDASRFTVAPNAVRQAMAAVLRAFDPDTTASRMIVTSRFPFQLVDGDENLAARLFDEELGELGVVARQKLTLRQFYASAALEGAAATDRRELLLQVEEIARGNPGLQDLLGSDLVLRTDIPIDDVRSVLGETAAFLAGSTDLPAALEISQFLIDLKLDETLELAGADGREFLRAMTNFEKPLPVEATEAVPGASEEIIRRLLALGLLLRVEDVVDRTKDALVPSHLAAARLTPLTETEKDRISSRVLRSLYKAWNR